MVKAGEIKSKQGKSKKYLLVRYGLMNLLGLFEHREGNIPRKPTRVVIKTERGLELGHLVGQLTSYKSGQFRLNPDEVKEYFVRSGLDYSVAPAGRVVRFASSDDVSEERHLKEIVKEEIECCRNFTGEMKLSMKIVDAEHIFGGERIIFYFMSEIRVDFRELVKRLAQEYQTRIEMRQIGARDEARILGDVESCGQECCCKRFLKALKPVNMRMAKMQKATLDPSKISGYCGRLKCCLRYEDETYMKLKKLLPKRNALVKTPHGEGRVIDAQILTQLVVVEHKDGKRMAIGVEEIEILSPPPKIRKSQKGENKDKGQKGSGESNNPEQKGDK